MLLLLCYLLMPCCLLIFLLLLSGVVERVLRLSRNWQLMYRCCSMTGQTPFWADPDLAGKFAALSSGISFWRDYLPQHVISGNKPRCASKILVPAALVPRVIAALHSYVHGGIEKTYHLVRRHLSVPSLKLDDLYAAVKTHCDACHVCQQSKPHVGVHADSLHYYLIPD